MKEEAVWKGRIF